MKTLDLVVKLVASALLLAGLLTFLAAFDASGMLGVLGRMVAGLFLGWTGAGLWRYRGWAYLVWSVMLLAGFFITEVEMILAVDRGEGWLAAAAPFVLDVVLIGYFGRWAVERRFRPHLDVETAHHPAGAPHGHAEPAPS